MNNGRKVFWIVVAIILVLCLIEAFMPGFIIGRFTRVSKKAEDNYRYSLANSLSMLLKSFKEDQGDTPNNIISFESYLERQKLTPKSKKEIYSLFQFKNIYLETTNIVVVGVESDEQGMVFAITDTGLIIKIPAWSAGTFTQQQ